MYFILEIDKEALDRPSQLANTTVTEPQVYFIPEFYKEAFGQPEYVMNDVAFELTTIWSYTYDERPFASMLRRFKFVAFLLWAFTLSSFLKASTAIRNASMPLARFIGASRSYITKSRTMIRGSEQATGTGRPRTWDQTSWAVSWTGTRGTIASIRTTRPGKS